MVERTFFAFDNELLVIDPSSPSGTPGAPIINNSNTPNGTIFFFPVTGSAELITIDDTGGDPDIFEDGIPGGHTVVDGGSLVADGTGVESESILTLQQLDADGNLIGPPVTLNVYSQNGVFSDIWGFSTDTELIPGARYVKIAGTNNGQSAYETFAPCFVTGTLIRTTSGEIPVEEVQIGTEVWTREDPAVPVTWVGAKEVAALGPLAPVRFEAGVLGNLRPLLVSPQHRVLISGYRAHLLFGEPEILVPAIGLLELDGVSRAPVETVIYHHFMAERHLVVCSEGALTESFFPGKAALSSLDRATRDELVHLFPDLGRREGPRRAAAPLATRNEGRAVAVMMSRALGAPQTINRGSQG
ncbi:MAG: Hint domain-containing protein [Pseudomonadota bacterium]